MYTRTCCVEQSAVLGGYILWRGTERNTKLIPKHIQRSSNYCNSEWRTGYFLYVWLYSLAFIWSCPLFFPLSNLQSNQSHQSADTSSQQDSTKGHGQQQHENAASSNGTTGKTQGSQATNQRASSAGDSSLVTADVSCLEIAAEEVGSTLLCYNKPAAGLDSRSTWCLIVLSYSVPCYSPGLRMIRFVATSS